jgi:hypothetical protein
MDLLMHWIAKATNSGEVIVRNQSDVDAYRRDHRWTVAGPFVLAPQLEGAVEALEAIRTLGAVCDQYETCEHRACRDSYAAWATADRYLRAQ